VFTGVLSGCRGVGAEALSFAQETIIRAAADKITKKILLAIISSFYSKKQDFHFIF